MGGQLVATNSLGGSLTDFGKLSAELYQQAYGQMIFRQFVDLKEGPGLRGGEMITFKKMLRIDTRGTRLNETGTIPKNLFKFVSGTATVSEWGNKDEYTGKLEKLAEWDASNKIQQGLLLDIKDTFDNAICTVFKTAEFKAVCSAAGTTVITTNGTATAVSTVSLSSTNVKDIVDFLRQKQVPKYRNGKKYVGILSINSMRGLYDDIESWDKYNEPHESFNYEVGSYYQTRFIEDDSYLSNTIGKSSVLGEGLIFGDEAILEVLAMEAKVVGAMDPSELGRLLYLGWWGIVDWYKFWSQSTDDLNSTGKGIERIMHITSG